MSVNKWTIMKKLNVVMVLALVAAVCNFLVLMNAEEYLGPFDRMIGAVAMAAFLLFLLVIIIWLKNTVDYIKTLNNEIHALEGGDLTREITVSGDGELMTLSESIDDFRKSMKAQLDTIEELEKSNRLMTAEIAHDMRTPLTALIMYLDFAPSELGDREPQAVEYVTKARERSVRLKTLMDENFTYTTPLESSPAQIQKLQAYEVLSNFLRDMMTYLENEGFSVRVDVVYGHSSVLVRREAVGRVFSNLTSNIMKYAKKDSEILMNVRDEGTQIAVRISNEVRCFEGERPESTGLGERIVKRLMEEMNGEYFAEETDGKYTAILRFAKA